MGYLRVIPDRFHAMVTRLRNNPAPGFRIDPLPWPVQPASRPAAPGPWIGWPLGERPGFARRYGGAALTDRAARVLMDR